MKELKNMCKWEVWYCVGNTYKYKIVEAVDAKTAIKKARIKNPVDLVIIEKHIKDEYLLRDF